MTTTADTMSRTGSLIHQAKFIDVDGIRTRYYELGSGVPVVLCHGSNWEGAASANTWTLNLGGLAKSFHVYAADTLGTGMTDNPARDEIEAARLGGADRIPLLVCEGRSYCRGAQ